MDTHLINLIVKLFKEFYENYPDSQVWSFSEDILLKKDNNEITSTNFKYIDSGTFDHGYLAVYDKYKRESKTYRKTYTVSLENHIYLAYYTMKYYVEIHNLNNTTDFLSRDISLKDFPLIKTYNFYPNNNLDFIEVDIKGFYPSLKINKICKILQKDNSDSLGKIKIFYERMYAAAGNEFGLLQNNWHTWLLADLYLRKIDDDFLEKGLEFYRKGDKYYFLKKKNNIDIMHFVNKIFAKYELSANTSKIKHKKKKKIFVNRSFISLKHKITVSFFPILIYTKYLKSNRNIICRIIKEAKGDNVNLQKLITRLLREASWGDFEYYHILQMADVYHIDTSEFLQLLSEKYSNASIFLKSQIRLQFFKFTDTESIIRLVKSTEIPKNEIEDILKTLSYLNWKDEKIENLMKEIEA
jgi:hypothetical protein